MKKFVLAALAVFMMTGAMAQNESKEGNKTQMTEEARAQVAKKHTEAMVKEYGLNEQQAEKLLELNKEYSGKVVMGRMDFMRGNNSGTRVNRGNGQRRMRQDSLRTMRPMADSTMRAKARDSRATYMKEYNARLAEILTAEQYAKYTEKAKSRSGKQVNANRDDKKD